MQITSETVNSKDNYLKLLSIIAHNVKGPIKYMEFITDFTLRNWSTMKPADLLDCATLINESASNISEQLEGLLSWARIQDRTFTPNIRPFNLKDVIATEIRIQRAIIRLKSIELTDLVDKEIVINSDNNLLRLVLHNIISNALKFTAKGGSISITSSIVHKNLMLGIKDNGVGIKPEDLALLYDDKSFSKLGTVSEQGTGFGLRISKEILDILHGSIEVDSEVGVGTTVTICLPV